MSFFFNTSTIMCSALCPCPIGIPTDSTTMPPNVTNTWRAQPFSARRRSLSNPEQLDSNCPGGGRKSGGKRSRPSGTCSLISTEILIGPRGCPISLFCSPISLFFLFFLVLSKIKHDYSKCSFPIYSVSCVEFTTTKSIWSALSMYGQFMGQWFVGMQM